MQQLSIAQRLLNAVDFRVKVMSGQDHIQAYTLNGEAITLHSLTCPCGRCGEAREKEKAERGE